MEFGLSQNPASISDGKYQPIDVPDAPPVEPERRKRVLVIAGWLTFSMVMLFITMSSSSGSTESSQSDADFLRSSHKASSVDAESHRHHQKTLTPTAQPTHVPQPPWMVWVPEPYRPAVPGEPSLPPTNSPPWTHFVPAPYQPEDPKNIADGSPPWAVYIPEPFNPFLSTPTTAPTGAPTPAVTHKPTASKDKPHHKDQDKDNDHGSKKESKPKR